MLNTNEDKPTAAKSPEQAPGIDPTKIKLGVPVVCSAGVQLGIVERVEGTSSLKLGKDDRGVNHFIPMSWIARVDDDRISANRPGEEIKSEWTTELPEA